MLLTRHDGVIFALLPKAAMRCQPLPPFRRRRFDTPVTV